MSSINGSNPPAGFQQGGIQMSGSNTDGGGGSFYMGGDEGSHQEDPQNPELVLANPGEVDRRSENRQYLEDLIIKTSSLGGLLSPWLINPDENLKTRGRKDVIVSNGEKKANKRFLVNA